MKLFKRDSGTQCLLQLMPSNINLPHQVLVNINIMSLASFQYHWQYVVPFLG